MKNELLQSIDYLEYILGILNEVRATDLMNIDRDVFHKTEKILTFIQKVKNEN